MCRDVTRFIALNLILRLAGISMMRITFKIKVRSVDFDDSSINRSTFIIPSHFITYFKFFSHKWSALINV